MAWNAAAVWMCYTLDGRATCLHVRWHEDGRMMSHDEQFDEPLEPEEAKSLLEFVEGTAS